MQKWKMPEYYFGEVWPEYYVFIAQHRDSDTLTRANWSAIVRDLEKEFGPECADSWLIVRESHWAVGWVEWIAIHQDNEKLVNWCNSVEQELSNYPVYDEDYLSELESTEAQEVWKNCYNIKERIAYIREHKSQFEFNSMLEVFEVCRGKYFIGYASELLD